MHPRSGNLEHIFSAWQEVSAQLRGVKFFLLLSDYDGTLTPIVERPDLAVISEEMKQLLRTITSQSHFAVGIISGRSLRDIQSRIGIKGITYVGNHGLEIEGPELSFIIPQPEEIRTTLQTLCQPLVQAMSSIKGVIVEDKELTISVHYRLAEESRADEIWDIITQVIEPLHSQGKVRVTSGKKIYEVRPTVDCDKGKAIAMLLDRYGRLKCQDGMLPIFLGDDITDEDGFKVIEKWRGISILVGEENRDTAARYFLKSPLEVERFLSMLLDETR